MYPAVHFNQYGLKVHGDLDPGHVSYRMGSDRNPSDDRSIVYQYNEDRLRTPVEISDLKFDNYMLISGCSFSEGIGLNIQDLYWFKLAKKLKIQPYSLALGGSGNDVIVYQVHTWLSKFPPPKILLIQLSSYDRVYCMKSGRTLMPGHFLSGGTIDTVSEGNFFTGRIDCENHRWDMMRHVSEINMLRRLLPNTKIYTIGVCVGGRHNPDNYPLEDFEFDFWLNGNGHPVARDGHHGPGSHTDLAEELARVAK